MIHSRGSEWISSTDPLFAAVVRGSPVVSARHRWNRLTRPIDEKNDGTCEIMTMTKKTLPVASWMLIACGGWLVALGFYFIILRPPLLPEDARFMGATLAQIHAAVPTIDAWLKKVFTVMGGFMAGAGVLTLFVAVVAMPSRMKGTSRAVALSGVLTVALMSAINFALASDFQWLLLIPALVWLAGFIAYVADR